MVAGAAPVTSAYRTSASPMTPPASSQRSRNNAIARVITLVPVFTLLPVVRAAGRVALTANYNKKTAMEDGPTMR